MDRLHVTSWYKILDFWKNFSVKSAKFSLIRSTRGLSWDTGPAWSPDTGAIIFNPLHLPEHRTLPPPPLFTPGIAVERWLLERAGAECVRVRDGVIE